MKNGDTVAGVLLNALSQAIPVMGIVYALAAPKIGKGICSTIPIPFFAGRTHAFTFTLLCGAFLLHYLSLRYLYPLARLITTLAITVFCIHFYDFSWSVFSFVGRGTAPNLPSLLIIVATSYILFRLDNVHGVFARFHAKSFLYALLPLFFTELGLLGMSLTGFWQQMALVDAGVAVDPNNNVWWVISKAFCFFVLYFYLDDRPLKAPLRLDPRVMSG